MEENFEENFTEVYNRNADRVYRLCYVYLKNRADAEDAVSSVFLKYLHAGVAFNGADHEKAWFMQTAKNCCIDMLRSFWRRRRVDLDTESVLHGRSDAEDDTAESGAVLEALFALPSKYRLALYLFYIEGYSVKETAQLLGRSESTVRTQLQRGRQKLKNDLENLKGE